ncbi:hypothetical protein Droror1_Dr00021709 [Drosera rotundifolia]
MTAPSPRHLASNDGNVIRFLPPFSIFDSLSLSPSSISVDDGSGGEDGFVTVAGDGDGDDEGNPRGKESDEWRGKGSGCGGDDRGERDDEMGYVNKGLIIDT